MHELVIFEAWRAWFFPCLAACILAVGHVALGVLAPNAVLALMDGDVLRAVGVRPPLSVFSNATSARIRRVTWLAVGAVGVAVSFAAFGWVVVRPWSALRSNQVAVASGLVSGMDTERGQVTVAGVRFQDAGHAIRAAYAEKAQRGEPVQKGMRVRVAYLGPRSDPTVVRVELLP